MNTYQWVQPSDVDVLTLQKNNEPILQITKDGGLYAPAALFTSLPMDNNLEGGILVINERGVVMASPVTLKAMGDAINVQLSNMNEGIKKSLESLEQQTIKQFNTIVDKINSNLLSIQSDLIARSIPVEDMKALMAEFEKEKASKSSEGVVTEGRENYHEEDYHERKFRRLEQMILLLFVLFAILFILVASVTFMSKSKK